MEWVHEAPPHGALMGAGTNSEAIGLLLEPRKPCYLGHWPGFLEVTHKIIFADENRTMTNSIEKNLLWLRPAGSHRSGLWFPPGRVLVCDDSLDLYMYLNMSAAAEYDKILKAYAIKTPIDSWPMLFPNGKSVKKTELLEKASTLLSSHVDTIVTLNHADLGGAGKGNLYTEFIGLPGMHTFKPLGCPVSTAFRTEAAYLMAHEINNPANFVSVGAQNVEAQLEEFQKFVGELLDEEADEEIVGAFTERFDRLKGSASTIRTGVTRIEAVVKALRAAHPEGETGAQATQLVDTLENAWVLVEPNLSVAVTVERALEAKPLVDCVVAQINQVFMAVLTNAGHAMEDAAASGRTPTSRD